MRYFCIVSYFGKNYQGWQKQDNFPSVEETIEKSLSQLFGEEINIIGSGRTDAGVHAVGQTFHFDASKKYTLKQLKYRLNCLLPKDIYINKISFCSNDFHARYSAKEKTYYYLIKLNDKDVFDFDRCWLIPYPIDKNKIKECLDLFLGEHCFADFTSKEIDDKCFVRNIKKIIYSQKGKNIRIELTGNGFMKYQIRFIIGACIAVACGKENIDFIKYHLQGNKNREIIRYKAPSEGLYLKEVKY